MLQDSPKFCIGSSVLACICLLSALLPYFCSSLFQAKDWKKSLQLYEEIKSIKLIPTVSTMNALITSLCRSTSRGKIAY
jgi:hypothetical protein